MTFLSQSDCCFLYQSLGRLSGLSELYGYDFLFSLLNTFLCPLSAKDRHQSSRFFFFLNKETPMQFISVYFFHLKFK